MDIAGAALNRVEEGRVDEFDDRRRIGGDLVEREDLLAFFVLLNQLDPEVLGRLVEHPLHALGLLQDLLDGSTRADLGLHGPTEQGLELVHLDDVRRVRHDDDEAPVLLRLGDEEIAEHELEGHGPEEVVVDPEARDVDELEPVHTGHLLGLFALVLQAHLRALENLLVVFLLRLRHQPDLTSIVPAH